MLGRRGGAGSQKGWLTADRREVRLGRHPLWLICTDDLERFLQECRPDYDAQRIRDWAWHTFVAGLPPERDPWLTPCEAAPLLCRTAHGVRKLIATRRLAARCWGASYFIRRSTPGEITPPSAASQDRGELGTRRSAACGDLAVPRTRLVS